MLNTVPDLSGRKKCIFFFFFLRYYEDVKKHHMVKGELKTDAINLINDLGIYSMSV